MFILAGSQELEDRIDGSYKVNQFAVQACCLSDQEYALSQELIASEILRYLSIRDYWSCALVLPCWKRFKAFPILLSDAHVGHLERLSASLSDPVKITRLALEEGGPTTTGGATFILTSVFQGMEDKATNLVELDLSHQMVDETDFLRLCTEASTRIPYLSCLYICLHHSSNRICANSLETSECSGVLQSLLSAKVRFIYIWDICCYIAVLECLQSVNYLVIREPPNVWLHQPALGLQFLHLRTLRVSVES
ncbi:unnamed protein product [Schistocephalus solidus]|uniref:F-box domain-containing protein n=1 Tax=Schistocephalus solidus TaxID=70667 RepID=A0A183SZB0_SCHSO|nr:unnamed protein product [Schistocephalus solidus]